MNTNIGRAKDVFKDIHEHIKDFAGKADRTDCNNYLTGNQLFSVMCSHKDSEPSEYADIMNNLYGYDLTRYDIMKIFRSLQIERTRERRALIEWAETVANFYAGAATGNREDFNKLEELRKNVPLHYIKRHGIQERVAAIMIYEKFPEFDTFEDRELLYRLGNVLAKNYFYHMYDALCRVYEFPFFSPERKKNDFDEKKRKFSYEQAVRKIEELEIELDRTNAMLGELQEEFETQLKDSKIAVLTDFFAHLNSDRYGNILDQLLQVRKGIDKLKKESYELPLEINGLFIMVKQLIQFMRDNHIEPIMKIHSRKEVSAKDIEFCDYEGDPFVNDTDIKLIEVISPGWVFKEHDVQISRPRVKEV